MREGAGDAPPLLTMLHEENWEIVFEIYAGRPGAALDLANHLMDIRKAILRGNKGKAEAIAAIDLAIAELYKYTTFNKVARKFYQLCIEARLTAKQEKILNDLGVKF